MLKVKFVEEVLRAAGELGYRIDHHKEKGRRIWFNERLRKYLWERDIAKLYPQLLDQNLTVAEANAIIDAVAPGKTATHVGMRRLVDAVRPHVQQSSSRF